MFGVLRHADPYVQDGRSVGVRIMFWTGLDSRHRGDGREDLIVFLIQDLPN